MKSGATPGGGAEAVRVASDTPHSGSPRTKTRFLSLWTRRVKAEEEEEKE